MNIDINPVMTSPDFTGYLGDLRLERRGNELCKKLIEHPSSSIRQVSSTQAEQKAYYRFLNNEKVEEQELIKEVSSRMSCLAKDRHLLCIQDTCEINLSKHKGRLKATSIN